MRRRHVLAGLACWPGDFLLAQQDADTPRQKISAKALHEVLSARFPVRFGLEGLLQVEVSAPRLHMVPSRNQLGAGLRAEASSVARRGTGEAGELDLVFGVRYERADRTIRAGQPEILGLHWPGLPQEIAEPVRAMLPLLARQALGDAVLHAFSARELALPDAMGLEPEKVTVLDDGLLVLFGPKTQR